MAKREFREQTNSMEMSIEEARARRAALHKPVERELADHEKREEFRLFWATNRNKYGGAKKLEEILWLHLKSSKLDHPKKFEEGLKHFGLKKVK